MSDWPEWILVTATSWEALVAVMVTPAIALLANFVFGDCFVADALESRRAGNIDAASAAAVSSPADAERVKKHVAAKRRGRATLVMVAVFLAWQYHAYMVTYRSRFKVTAEWTPPDTGDCSPVHFVWRLVAILGDLVGAILTPLNDNSGEDVSAMPLTATIAALLRCQYQEMMFLFFFFSFVALHLQLLFSVPQAAAPRNSLSESAAALVSPKSPVLPPGMPAPPTPLLPSGVTLPAGVAPARALPTQQVAAAARPDGASFCSKCNAFVPGMCHHCYFVANCVSAPTNRILFMYLLAVVVCQSMFLIMQASAWFVHVVVRGQLIDGIVEDGTAAWSGALSFLKVFSSTGPQEVKLLKYFRGLTRFEVLEIALGMSFSGACLATVFLFFVFQLLLIFRGLTMVTFFKKCRERRQATQRGDKPQSHHQQHFYSTNRVLRYFGDQRQLLDDIVVLLVMPLFKPLRAKARSSG